MDKPNIIIILLDAVRANNLSIYGYERETTPNLEKIKDELHIYRDAISASHWSLPSAASLFTGTYPSTHGLIHDNTFLDSSFTTLAQLLKTQGYRTIGICPNPYISNETGLDRGFDVFPGRAVDPFKNILARFREEKEKIEDRFDRQEAEQKQPLGDAPNTGILRRIEWALRGITDKYATWTNRRFFSEIENMDKGQSFFAYIHYDEAHTPYILPDKYRTHFQVNKEVRPWNVNQDWVKYYLDNLIVSEEEFQALIDIYDGGIMYLDEMINSIYKFLEKKSLLENTMICILGDHGDQYGEHGLYYHLFSLYDELIKIPMVVKYPQGITELAADTIQNIDIFPTIIDVLNINNNAILNQVEGNSLVSKKILKRDPKYAYSELLKPFGPKILKHREKLKVFDRMLFSLRSSNYKYIYSTDGRHEFYDLKSDPLESKNIINEDIEVIKEYSHKIKKWANKNRVNLPISQEQCILNEEDAT